jgi:hypothetical protein
VGATSITVISADGWKVNDEIVIGPTNYEYTEFEKRTIVSITPGTGNFVV